MSFSHRCTQLAYGAEAPPPTWATHRNSGMGAPENRPDGHARLNNLRSSGDPATANVTAAAPLDPRLPLPAFTVAGPNASHRRPAAFLRLQRGNHRVGGCHEVLWRSSHPDRPPTTGPLTPRQPVHILLSTIIQRSASRRALERSRAEYKGVSSDSNSSTLS
jgi:hypothetical protein